MNNIGKLGLIASVAASALVGGCNSETQTSPNISEAEAVAMASDTAKGLSGDEVLAKDVERKMNAGKSKAEIAENEKFFEDMRARREKDKHYNNFSSEEEVQPAQQSED